MSIEEKSWGNYFIGAVPAGMIFKMSLDDLHEILNTPKESHLILNTSAEVCLIALVAYFEAFCKNQFAAIINICPQLLNNFCEKRVDTTIQLKDLLTYDNYSKDTLGFILAEKYDFGSAKSINSIFRDLLLITPFSEKDIKKYERLLSDRNLLVHHAGIYTIKYHEQILKKTLSTNRIHMDSLRITNNNYLEWAEFLNEIAQKILKISKQKLLKFIEEENIKLSKGHKEALEYIAEYEF